MRQYDSTFRFVRAEAACVDNSTRAGGTTSLIDFDSVFVFMKHRGAVAVRPI